MSLVQNVLDPDRRCVNLRDQRGGLTAAVLESLRAFLRYNDRYIHLCVSDNLLGSEAMAELCALVKKHPHLVSLEAQHCGLLDKDFRYYVGPAITTMSRLTFLDLSRNCGLTDISAEAVGRIIVDTEVETIRLVGTSFTEVGGRIIAAAAQNTTSLMSCELPFTVGTAVLADIDERTRRNRAHRAMLCNANAQYARLRVSQQNLPTLPALHAAGAMAFINAEDSTMSGGKRRLSPLLEVGPNVSETDADRQWRACINKGRKQALPQAEQLMPSSPSRKASDASTGSSTMRTLTTANVTGTQLPLAQRRWKATPHTLNDVTMWDWTDPAMSTALHCLYVLDHQSQLLAHHRTDVAAAAASAAAPKANRRSRAAQPKRADGIAARLPSL